MQLHARENENNGKGRLILGRSWRIEQICSGGAQDDPDRRRCLLFHTS